MARPKSFKKGLRHLTALASANALIEKSAFHRIACESARFQEPLARCPPPPATQFELADGSEVEGIVGKPMAILDSADFTQTPFGAIALSDGDSSI